jgi:hypothetical protein
MLTLKIEILGSIIEINYQEKDFERLNQLISTFKQRLNEFANDGRNNKNTIMLLAALKAEDQIQEIEKDLAKNKINQNIAAEQKKEIEELNNNIVFLKTKLNILNENNLIEKNNNLLCVEEIEKLDNRLELLQNRIKDSIK